MQDENKHERIRVEFPETIHIKENQTLEFETCIDPKKEKGKILNYTVTDND